MPLYEYICEECSAEFEKMMRLIRQIKYLFARLPSGLTQEIDHVFSSQEEGAFSPGASSASSCSAGTADSLEDSTHPCVTGRGTIAESA